MCKIKIKPKWIVEECHHSLDLIKEIRDQGMEVETNNLFIFKHDLIMGKYLDECVIFTGNISSCQIVKKYPISPGSWLTENNYKCSTYYSKFGHSLLNDKYIMLPFFEFERNFDFVYSLFKSDKLFIRPDSGLKTFTGRVINKKEIENCEIQWEYLKECVLNDEMILIAPVKDIVKEFRFVIRNHTVLTGSTYLINNEYHESKKYDEDAFKFAELVVKMDWVPDPLWVLDVAKERNGKYSILEINSFSCAGLYKCNMAPIVKSVSEQAIEDYQKYLEKF